MLNAQITRNGEPLQLNWTWWMLNVCCDVAKRQGVNIMSTGECVVAEDIGYFNSEDDTERVDLQAGDVIRMWRGGF